MRACSKCTGQNLSPCGMPTLLVNGFDVEVPFIVSYERPRPPEKDSCRPSGKGL